MPKAVMVPICSDGSHARLGVPKSAIHIIAYYSLFKSLQFHYLYTKVNRCSRPGLYVLVCVWFFSEHMRFLCKYTYMYQIHVHYIRHIHIRIHAHIHSCKQTYRSFKIHVHLHVHLHTYVHKYTYIFQLT